MKTRGWPCWSAASDSRHRHSRVLTSWPSSCILTVFGSTRGTGAHVVRLALEAGHPVTAAARDLDPASLAGSVHGADTVVSTLGAANGRQPSTVYSTAGADILDAMRAAGVRRFLGVSAVPVAPRHQLGPVERLVVHPVRHRFFGARYADMARMEHLLRPSDADWTIVRPPRLTDGARTGQYRSAVDHHLRGGRSTSPPRPGGAAGRPGVAAAGRSIPSLSRSPKATTVARSSPLGRTTTNIRSSLVSVEYESTGKDVQRVRLQRHVPVLRHTLPPHEAAHHRLRAVTTRAGCSERVTVCANGWLPSSAASHHVGSYSYRSGAFKESSDGMASRS